MLDKCDLIITRGQLEVLGKFTSTGHFFLIDQSDESVGVLKILQKANPKVYLYLMRHPHRNVCMVLDFWEKDGMQFVLEEYLTGKTLDEYFREGGISEDAAIDILGQICDGVHFLHSADPPIVHKDLKMMNVMIDRAGCVKIIDFDISRIYREGAARDTYQFGTEPFASPEHYGFGQTNVKSDQYAIGQMMREMGLEHGHLAKVIAKATQVDWNNRYKDIMSMKQDIMKKDFQYFPLPGFRTHMLWKEILAVLGYIAIPWFSFYIKIEGERTANELLAYRVVVFLMLVTEVDLFTKWSPIFSGMTFLYDKNILLRIIYHALVVVAVFAVWCLILLIAVSFCK